MFNTHECAVRIIKDNLSENEAFQYEIEMIKYYRNQTNFRLTNVKDGGEGGSGYHPTQEVRDHASRVHKEKWADPEYREKMLLLRSDPNSVYKSEKFRKKISDIVRGENNPNYNHRWTDEMKKHLSEVRKLSGVSKDENNPKAKNVICLETGKVYSCIKFAMQEYGVKDETSFSAALRERHRTAGDNHWLIYDARLEDDNERYNELITSLSLSEKPSLVCVQNKEIFKNRKTFLEKFHIGIKRFKKEYNPETGIALNNQNYMYAKDYYSRFIQ